MIHVFLNFPLNTFDYKWSVLSNYNSIPRCKFIIRNLLQASNEKVWGKSNAMGPTPRVGRRHGLYANFSNKMNDWKYYLVFWWQLNIDDINIFQMAYLFKHRILSIQFSYIKIVFANFSIKSSNPVEYFSIFINNHMLRQSPLSKSVLFQVL